MMARRTRSTRRTRRTRRTRISEMTKGGMGARTGGRRFASGFIATPGYKGLGYRLGAAPEKRRLKSTALNPMISA